MGSAAEPGGAGVALITALPAEARPLIEHFGLVPLPGAMPFRHFIAEDHDLRLTISGVGRAASAAATVAVCRAPAASLGLLNVGIAGHATHALGEVFLAHRIDDAEGGERWYPPLVFPVPCPTATVCTVDSPTSTYPDDALYDMEAAGFCATAVRHRPRELVHALKVISDNRDNPAGALGGARVQELIRSALPEIASVVESLRTLVDEQRRLRAEPTGFAEVLARAHFSTTRRRQLRRLLRRWAALRPDVDVVAWVARRGGDDAGQIVAALRQRLDHIAPALAPRR